MTTTSRRIGDRAGPLRPVPATLDERLGVLARQGYRVTPQRAAVLAGLHGTGKMNATADEICQQARMLCPTVNLATTYRTLDLFGRLGIIRRVTTGDGGSVFSQTRSLTTTGPASGAVRSWTCPGEAWRRMSPEVWQSSGTAYSMS